MATIRKGSNAALLIMDVQVGVMCDTWDDARIIKNIGIVLQKARSRNVPVIWVQHTSEDLIPDSPAWQIVPQFVPAPGEPQISKKFNSAFEESSLEETLAGFGTSHIVLTGVATNWCLRATAYAALERGYDLTLIEDAHTTATLDFDDGTKIEARDLIQDLNATMTWLEYPGRKNAVASAERFDF